MDLFLEGVQLENLLSIVYGGLPLAGVLAADQEGFEDGHQHGREALALLQTPVVIIAGQKGTTIAGKGCLQRSFGFGRLTRWLRTESKGHLLFELRHIQIEGANGLEADGGDIRFETIGIRQDAADMPEGGAEAGKGSIPGRVGPETGSQLLAGQGSRALHHEVGEQGLPLAGSGQRPGIARYL